MIKTACLLILALSAHAQNPYHIVFAELQQILGKSKTSLTGKVHLRRDTVNVYGYKATLYSNDQAYLSGNVRLESGTKSSITSRSAHLDGTNSIGRFYRNVEVLTADFKANSDTLFHYDGLNESRFFGRVVAVSYADSSITKGDRMVVENRELFKVFGNAKYELLQESLFVQSDTLYHSAASNRATARGKVKIEQNGMQAFAGLSHFYRQDSIMKLYKKPVVYFENNMIQGDSIFAYFGADGIKEIHVHGHAFTINVVDSATQKLNRILGKNIYIYLKNSKINRIRSIQNAISIYYFREDDLDKGVNSVSSDSLIVDFVNGQVEQTQIFGGVEGVFYPPEFRGIIKDDY